MPDPAAVRALLVPLLQLMTPLLPPPGSPEALPAVLAAQIALSAPKEDAAALSARFFDDFPSLCDAAAADLEACFLGDPAAASREEVALAYPGFRAIRIHRIAHRLYLLGVPLLPRLIAEIAHSDTGIDIHPGAQIGPGCFIDHGTGLVVGETAVIGPDCKLYHGVTLGALTTRGGQQLRGARRHPTLGRGVTVYAGASVLGGDTVVGDGATIGSGAFVTHSIPAGTRVPANAVV